MGHERENAAVDNFVYCLLVELFRCLVVEGNKDDGKDWIKKVGRCRVKLVMPLNKTKSKCMFFEYFRTVLKINPIGKHCA